MSEAPEQRWRRHHAGALSALRRVDGSAQDAEHLEAAKEALLAALEAATELQDAIGRDMRQARTLRRLVVTCGRLGDWVNVWHAANLLGEVAKRPWAPGPGARDWAWQRQEAASRALELPRPRIVRGQLPPAELQAAEELGRRLAGADARIGAARWARRAWAQTFTPDAPPQPPLGGLHRLELEYLTARGDWQRADGAYREALAHAARSLRGWWDCVRTPPSVVAVRAAADDFALLLDGYADTLRHLGRDAESERMTAKARAVRAKRDAFPIDEAER